MKRCMLLPKYRQGVDTRHMREHSQYRDRTAHRQIGTQDREDKVPFLGLQLQPKIHLAIIKRLGPRRCADREMAGLIL